MYEVEKEYAGDSGPNWVVDLDGPDGNVFNLWGMLEQFWQAYGWEGDPIWESKNGGHYANRDDAPYKGYEGVLDFCFHQLMPSPAGVEFRVYGTEVTCVGEYKDALAEG